MVGLKPTNDSIKQYLNFQQPDAPVCCGSLENCPSIDFKFAWDDQLRLAAFFAIDTPFAVPMKCWYFWSVS